MIVSLEGPDRVGKSSVHRELHKHVSAKMVPGMPMLRELWHVIAYVEARQAALWSALYDPLRLYVCDRCVFTSAPVYDRLHGRPLLVDIRPWTEDIVVLYMDAPREVLEARWQASGGDELFPWELYSEVKALYEEHVLKVFKHLRVDASQPLEDVVRDVVSMIRYVKGGVLCG